MELTNNTKLLTAISILPVLADFLEDMPFNRETKYRANLLINNIRSLDRYLIDTCPAEGMVEQVDLQLLFRQWVKEIQNNK